jgi:CRP/FNR family transcriptional regulator, cyclic AMP receptor protein
VTTNNGPLRLRAALARSALFGAMPAAARDALAGIAHPRRFAAGALICREGEADGTLFVVVQGRVRISSTSSEGDERYLNELGPGELFGEIALLDGGRRSASVTAVEACELYCVERRAFAALLERTPELARATIELLCRRVRWLTELFEASAFLDIPARLARWLTLLATQQGTRSARGVEMRISQRELADFLGVSRQSVNQILRGWQHAGLIEIGRARLVIRDDRQLVRAASVADLAD